jgi:two-component system sensor histidine kinase/response regulator
VTINVQEKNDQIYVGVRDHGIGIGPEEQKSLFEKFYRVEETALHFQGLGIGLYISSEIIRRHGGEVGVQSTLGEGSEFFFKIPVIAPSEID